MEEVKKVVDNDVVAEEVVQATQSEESLPETTADGDSSQDTVLASVEDDSTATDEVEKVEPEETPSEESSLETEEVPFNKNPKFQERVAEIETKYGKKAQMWDTLAKLSSNDPDFQLELTKRLEAAGEIPKGTYELAKKRFETPGKEEKKPDEISDKISNLPEVQFARQLMDEKRKEKEAEDLKIESTLQSFEKKHPNIATSAKAEILRSRIAVLAEGYKEEGLSYEDSLEEAYNILFNKESMLAQAREKGEIEGQIKADIKSVASTPTVNQGAASSGLRKLSREEEEARVLLGYSKEEYIKFKDSDGSVE